jgi:nitrogen fixation-related uncharacterized protein
MSRSERVAQVMIVVAVLIACLALYVFACTFGGCS